MRNAQWICESHNNFGEEIWMGAKLRKKKKKEVAWKDIMIAFAESDTQDGKQSCHIKWMQKHPKR